MFIEIISFILILVIQLSLGSYAYTSRRRIVKKYSKALSSGVDLSETLESLMTILNKFNIQVKVIKNLNSPVVSKDGALYINRESIYRTDLYTNYKAVYEVVSSSKGFLFKTLPKLQFFFFILSVLLIIIGSFLQSDFGDILVRVAIGIEISLIAFSYLIYFYTDRIFKKMQRYAFQIFDMDNVELARSVSLNKDLRLTPFEYAFKPLGSVIEFFSK